MIDISITKEVLARQRQLIDSICKDVIYATTPLEYTRRVEDLILVIKVTLAEIEETLE
jgi:hypothetical protein